MKKEENNKLSIVGKDEVKKTIEVEKVSVSDGKENNLPEKKKFNPIEDMKETLFMGVIESVLPKIKPFLNPAIEKLNEYFGNDEKFFIMKKFGNSIRVVIVDDTINEKKGVYDISRYFDEEDNTYKKTFTIAKGAVIANIDIEEFMEKMLLGELTKGIEK